MTTSTLSCGPLTISADFDSGNVLSAELLYPGGDGGGGGRSPSTSKSSFSSSPIAFQLENQDYEINVWTRPDCHGTVWQNGNRTWFHFGINGGKPNSIVKINIMNINKQSKLFVQGMQPVYRILPDRPKWMRIEDRVVINENKPLENGCNITFRIKLPENTYKSTLLIAFTYPFGYSELCDLLKDLDAEFLNKVSKAGGSLPKPRINRRDLSLHASAQNEIYYHRECVCYSLEGRRVDLLTITSIYGKSENREDRLSNLFPILEEPRPFKFPGKKVVFLSARVHPGETPSSFVLNGFLRFIMHKTDPRAVILRKLFVFKFIPILNPDGVYKGHYRTDPRGVNLNRVYLNPSAKLHPSIYAARKLLIYYHCGIDAMHEYEESEENVLHPPIDNTVIDEFDKFDYDVAEPSCSRSYTKMDSEFFSEDACFDPLPRPGNSGVLNPHTLECTMASSSKKPYTFVLSDTNSICAGCVPLDDTTNSPATPLQQTHLNGSCNLLNESFNNSTHQCAFEACDEDSVYYENLKLHDSQPNNNMEVDLQAEPDTPPQMLQSTRSESHLSPIPIKNNGPTGNDNKKPRSSSLTETLSNDRRLGNAGATKDTRSGSLAGKSTNSSGVFSGMKWPFDMKTSRLTRSQKSGMPGYRNTSTSRYYDSSSGLFLYVDMHGHTTKRGIFMYGNHFPEVGTQAECMLVPRVMALNSPHFDFAACNFTERLMCCKDKKDGMSREGSGRVACLKLTGLVRSYTLECNYNTGRVVNPVVSRTVNSGFIDDTAPAAFQPPQFTIELFEQIGRSLAETVLDMSGQNPYSRLSATEFKTVEGVKRSLIARLKLSPEFKTPTNLSTGPESPLKIGSLFPLDANGNPIPSKAGAGARLGSKSNKKSTVLTPSQIGGGPLGPKNRNRNSAENSRPLSGSQSKKLPKKNQSLSDDPSSSVMAATSSSLNKSRSLPKSKVTKIMKIQTFPRVSSAKGRGKTKKPSNDANALPK